MLNYVTWKNNEQRRYILQNISKTNAIYIHRILGNFTSSGTVPISITATGLDKTHVFRLKKLNLNGLHTNTKIGSRGNIAQLPEYHHTRALMHVRVHVCVYVELSY